MGIIRAAMSAVGGTLADSWLESIEAESMDNRTLIAPGVAVRRDDKRNHNTKGSKGVITNGSVIHVAQNQFAVLVDGGKVVDYSAEPGYFVVDTGSAPSLFNGEFSESMQDVFTRVKFGGSSPVSMQVYFLNLQEIRDIPFGTPTPLNYFDNFYNAELFLRANGYYSIRVTNPMLFYAEMGLRTGGRLTVDSLQKSCLSEFLSALQTSLGQLSMQGVRISNVGAMNAQLAKELSAALDDDWTQRRGMQIESVGINAISYDEDSKKLINMRNQGAMLSDPTVREGYVQGAAARGIEAAGSNTAGAATAFMGMGMAQQQAGSFVAAAGANNQHAAAQQQAAAPADGWACPKCNAQAVGNFCQNCGQSKPAATFCPGCGKPVAEGAKFCQSCGQKL